MHKWGCNEVDRGVGFSRGARQWWRIDDAGEKGAKRNLAQCKWGELLASVIYLCIKCDFQLYLTLILARGVNLRYVGGQHACA